MEYQLMVEIVEKYGLPGLAIVSFINNAIPGLPPFYLTVISAYAAVSENSHWLATALYAGLGAGIGKVALFAASLYAFSKTGRGRRVKQYSAKLMESRRAKVSLAIAIFFIALLPIPDDIIYIPLAATFYNLLYFSIAVVTGKLVLVTLFYGVGRASKGLISAVLDYLLPEAPTAGYPLGAVLALVAVSLGFSLAIAAVVLAIDWTSVYTAYINQGSRAAAKTFFKEMARVASNTKTAVRDAVRTGRSLISKA
ncbi:hypothetical protein APE_1930 [Aeropyrum pernix K1]|uniref:SNARE associated Golgi protein n=1 Tax=Aeropyrum pernix (strain ATCC 700893 / DSM 11879 / JCM 9820 / NBRC 100138 / K1) TaxID=272557 RepID=Q9YAL0_AERPE|nr:hypothetical protein [Aeropyrum pernix]BAA80939.1 hypothetical protein APE_1930 [Aeropyrum pernix K1]